MLEQVVVTSVHGNNFYLSVSTIIFLSKIITRYDSSAKPGGSALRTAVQSLVLYITNQNDESLYSLSKCLRNKRSVLYYLLFRIWLQSPIPFLLPVYCIKSFPFPPFTHFHLHKLKLPFQYRLPLLSFHLQVFALNFPPER